MHRGQKTMAKTKVFISQPMRGLSPEYLSAVRSAAISEIRNRMGEDVEIIENIKDLGEGRSPVWYLGKAIQQMSEADLAYFCPGWDQYKGCSIEHRICLNYGIEIMRD